MRSYTQIAIPHLALALAAGCFPADLPDQFYELTAALESDATSSGSGGDVTGGSTVTGDVTSGGGDGTWTGGADGDPPPEIKGIAINGEPCGDGDTCSLDAAGPLAISITARDDHAVQRITLTIGGEIEEELDEGTYSEGAWYFEHTRVITSNLDLPQPGPGNKLEIRAVAYDNAAQASPAKTVEFGLNMPAGGLNAWERGGADGVAQAAAVAEDGLVVIGRTWESSKAVLRKYDFAGNEEWELEFPEEPGGPSTGYDVVVDRQGVIYATGALRETPLGEQHLWILRYDPRPDADDAVTTYRHSEPSTGRAILLDEDEKFVYVVGQRIVVDNRGDALIMRRHADDIAGYDQGVYEYKPMNSVDEPLKHSIFRSAAFVAKDQLVAVGTVWTHANQSKGLLARLGSHGQLVEEWNMSSIADYHEVFASVAVDPEGRIFTTGRRLVDDKESEMWIARHDKDGMTSKGLADLRCGDDGCQIAVDPAGRLVIGGAERKPGEHASVHIRKAALDLAGIWEYASSEVAGQRRCIGLAIDPSGYIYGVGFAAKFGDSPRWWLAKVNP